jgi:hypothetical protein
VRDQCRATRCAATSPPPHLINLDELVLAAERCHERALVRRRLLALYKAERLEHRLDLGAVEAAIAVRVIPLEERARVGLKRATGVRRAKRH